MLHAFGYARTAVAAALLLFAAAEPVDAQWVASDSRALYRLGFSAPQTTAYSADQVLGHHRCSAAITIPANFGAHRSNTSQAGGSANATGSTAFSVQKAANATPNTFAEVGTITFGAGGVTPTFATSGGTSFNCAQGDVLRIKAPAAPDATFAGFYTTIVGFEQ